MVSEELVIESIQGLPPAAATDISYENLVELPTTPVCTHATVRTFEQPEEDTAYPLEYAFHLLDGVQGRTVIDLGCGSGLNTVILANLGAQVISIDRSRANLEMTERRARMHGVADRVSVVYSAGFSIPAAPGCADRVLCNANNVIAESADPLGVARQIRRVLKPGGRAVFHEVAGITLQRRRNGLRLTAEYTRRLSRGVGIPGRVKEFWLVTGLLYSLGIAPSSQLARTAQRLDAALLRRFPLARPFASALIWEARKES